MSEDLLVVSNVVSGYGSVSVINDVSIRVRRGEIVSLVGANGAGKSTLLNTISGIIPLKSGSVSLEGEDLAGRSAATVSRKGLRHVPEGRRVFADLTVEENLWLGGYRQPKQDVAGGWIIYTGASPVWRNGAGRRLAPCPAGSSRCWPSVAPLPPVRRF